MISLASKKPIAKPTNGMMILQPVPQGWDLGMLVDFPTCFVGRVFILCVEFFCVFVYFFPIFLNVPPTVPCSLFLVPFEIWYQFWIFAGPDELCERTLCVCAELSNQLIFLAYIQSIYGPLSSDEAPSCDVYLDIFPRPDGSGWTLGLQMTHSSASINAVTSSTGRVHRSHPPCNQLKALASATVTSVVLADEATKCPK